MIQLGRYIHYKGQEYRVLGVVRHSETEEWMVYYQALYGDYGYWVRPLDMFIGEVESAGGRRVRRFAYIAPE